jgi:hypothetical protein
MSAIKPTTYHVQVKISEAAGCRYVRTQGDHLVYSYPGAMRPNIDDGHGTQHTIILSIHIPARCDLS